MPDSPALSKLSDHFQSIHTPVSVRGERGLDDLEGRLADFDKLDIDVDDAQIKGDLAVMELAIYE